MTSRGQQTPVPAVFGEGGIVDRYERRGDELIEAGLVAQELADTVPGLSREVVLRRIARTAQRGEFGLRRAPGRNIVINTVDLTGTGFEPGQYPLRPSIFTVARLTAAELSISTDSKRL